MRPAARPLPAARPPHLAPPNLALAPPQDEVPGAGRPPRPDGPQQGPGGPRQAWAPGAPGRGALARAHPVPHPLGRSVCGGRRGAQPARGPTPTPASRPSRPRPPDWHLPGTPGEEPAAAARAAPPPRPRSFSRARLSPHAVLSRPCLAGSLTTGCLQPCPLPDLSMTCRYRALLALGRTAPTASCRLSALPVAQPCPLLLRSLPCVSVASPAPAAPSPRAPLGGFPPLRAGRSPDQPFSHHSPRILPRSCGPWKHLPAQVREGAAGRGWGGVGVGGPLPSGRLGPSAHFGPVPLARSAGGGRRGGHGASGQALSGHSGPRGGDAVQQPPCSAAGAPRPGPGPLLEGRGTSPDLGRGPCQLRRRPGPSLLTWLLAF